MGRNFGFRVLSNLCFDNTEAFLGEHPMKVGGG